MYGRLRDAGFGSAVSLDLPASATARQALAALAAALENPGLLKGCALATPDAVLSPADRLPAGPLAALPPVCGG